MNVRHRITTTRFKSKLVVVPLAAFALAIAGVAAGPVLQAAGIKEPPGQQKRTFAITGDFALKLSPGASTPLELTFDNPNQQALKIEQLRVAVQSTSSSGCHVNNFSTSAFTGTYPITIPTGVSTLSAAVPNSSKWPRIEMINKATVNQDACKGVAVRLSYDAVASK